MTKKPLKELPLASEEEKDLDFDKLISDINPNGDDIIRQSPHGMNPLNKNTPIKLTEDKINPKLVKVDQAPIKTFTEDVYVLDGQRISLTASDLDGDGIVGGTEIIQRKYRNESDIVQPTELGETLKELNKDVVEEDSRMSSIDLKARLSSAEVGAILAYDTLVAMKFLPRDALFLTRQRKRLSVSEGGQGRKETVDIVRGVKDEKSSSGFGDKIAGMFGGKPK
jgi:hypothetical protein